MVIVVFEVSGNWRICSLRPAIAADEQDQQADHARKHRPADEKIGEGVHRAPSGFRRDCGRGQSGRRIDGDGRIGLQLDLPGGHHLLARLHPFLDRNPLAPRRADLDEPALDHECASRRGAAAAAPPLA